jgi:hypothetical protein
MPSALAIEIPYDVQKSIDFLQIKIVPLAVLSFLFIYIGGGALCIASLASIANQNHLT